MAFFPNTPSRLLKVTACPCAFFKSVCSRSTVFAISAVLDMFDNADISSTRSASSRVVVSKISCASFWSSSNLCASANASASCAARARRSRVGQNCAVARVALSSSDRARRCAASAS